MGELDTSISSLKRLRDQFEEDFKQFPDLYYAIIGGPAVKNGGPGFLQSTGEYLGVEDYLKEHVATGKPCSDSVGWKYP
ncbi:MAG: hypothetical protein NTW19_01245, partial [Planctomycetota bacterium]|nr:hypothetical protein [Planctomycetota bacterium]